MIFLCLHQNLLTHFLHEQSQYKWGLFTWNEHFNINTRNFHRDIDLWFSPAPMWSLTKFAFNKSNCLTHLLFLFSAFPNPFFYRFSLVYLPPPLLPIFHSVSFWQFLVRCVQIFPSFVYEVWQLLHFGNQVWIASEMLDSTTFQQKCITVLALDWH